MVALDQTVVIGEVCTGCPKECSMYNMAAVYFIPLVFRVLLTKMSSSVYLMDCHRRASRVLL